jgi:hypothetical protein
VRVRRAEFPSHTFQGRRSATARSGQSAKNRCQEPFLFITVESGVEHKLCRPGLGRFSNNATRKWIATRRGAGHHNQLFFCVLHSSCHGIGGRRASRTAHARDRSPGCRLFCRESRGHPGIGRAVRWQSQDSLAFQAAWMAPRNSLTRACIASDCADSASMAESTSLDAVPVRCVASVTPEMPEDMSRVPTAAILAPSALPSRECRRDSVACT